MHTVWNILWWHFTKNRSFSIPLIVNQSHNYVFFLLHKRGSVERNEKWIQSFGGKPSGERQRYEPELGNCNIKVDLKKFEYEGVN